MRKDARSKEWDRVIGEAKARVDAVEIEQERRLALLADANREYDDDRSRENERFYRHVVVPYVLEAREIVKYGGKQSWSYIFEWAEESERQRAAWGFQDFRGPPLELLQSLSPTQIQDLLNDEGILRRFYGGPNCAHLAPEAPNQPLATKKNRTLEWSVLKLVVRLLLHSSEGSATPSADHSLLSARDRWREVLSMAQDRIRMIELIDAKSHIPKDSESPQAPTYDRKWEEQHDEVTNMNMAIRSLFRDVESGQKQFVSIKGVCEALLHCHTPLNIQTYNILLLGFWKLKQDEPVHAVLESLQETHTRPNEITHAAALRFFTLTNNRIKFRRYLEKMRGITRAFALADPDKSISPIAMSQYHYFGVDPVRIAIKARMNLQVYTSLICGIFHLYSRTEAIKYYVDMVNEGWTPTLEVMIAILRDVCMRAAKACKKDATRSNWQSFYWNEAKAVWKETEKLRLLGNKVFYELMLRVCQQCNQKSSFDEILYHGVKRGILPPTVYRLPPEVKDGDPTDFIENAESLKQPLIMKALHPRLKKQLRNLLNIGRTTLDNILYTDGTYEDIRVKAMTIYEDLVRVSDLREAFQAINDKLELLVNEMAILTEEVVFLVQFQSAKTLEWKLSVWIKHAKKGATHDNIDTQSSRFERLLNRTMKEELRKTEVSPSLSFAESLQRSSLSEYDDYIVDDMQVPEPNAVEPADLLSPHQSRSFSSSLSGAFDDSPRHAPECSSLPAEPTDYRSIHSARVHQSGRSEEAMLPDNLRGQISLTPIILKKTPRHESEGSDSPATATDNGSALGLEGESSIRNEETVSPDISKPRTSPHAVETKDSPSHTCRGLVLSAGANRIDRYLAQEEIFA